MEGQVEDPATPEDLQMVLDKYEDLFKVPTELPPSRQHDHKVLPKEGTSPINIRPYMYPVIQKDEIEKMVEELLESEL